MKRMVWLLGLSIMVALATLCGAADDVSPASVTITNLREEAVGNVSEETYYEGTTLRLTNCVAFSGTTTNSAVQGLDTVTVSVDVGTSTTNRSFSGTVQAAASGTWWCDIVVPDFVSAPYLQVKLEDASGSIYIYPWKQLKTKDSL